MSALTNTAPAESTEVTAGGQAGDLCRRILNIHEQVSNASADLHRMFAQTSIDLSRLLADGYQLHSQSLNVGFADVALQLHRILVTLSNVQIDVSRVTDTAIHLPDMVKAFAYDRDIDLNAAESDEPTS